MYISEKHTYKNINQHLCEMETLRNDRGGNSRHMFAKQRALGCRV